MKARVKVTSAVSEEGSEADGLEEILDAVAATNNSNGKRRRSKKKILEQMEGLNFVNF